MERERSQHLAGALARLGGPGDVLHCLRVEEFEDGAVCEICGYTHVRRLYDVRNTRTREDFRVDALCLLTAQRIMQERDEPLLDLRFPLAYQEDVLRLDEHVAGSASVDDTLLEDEDATYVDPPRDLEVLDELAPEGSGVDEIDWSAKDADTPR